MAVVLVVLVPRAGAELADRTRAVRSDLANALIVERQFLHPMDGLTIFITDTGRPGEMTGIFLNDQRDPERPVTYSAERARLVREGMEARLVMLEGVALASGGSGAAADGRALRPVRLRPERAHPRPGGRARAPAVGIPGARAPAPVRRRCSRAAATRSPTYVAEAHYKISMPILAAIYPMIALVTLLAGGYRRAGFGKRVVVAIGVATCLHILTFAARARVQERRSSGR